MAASQGPVDPDHQTSSGQLCGSHGTCRVDLHARIRNAWGPRSRREHNVRVLMMIKGDREPGHVPGEELLTEMAKYNEQLSKAGLLLDLGALHWSAEGVRVKYSGGKRTVTQGPFGEPKEIVAGYWILQVKSMEEAIEWAKRVPFEAAGEPDAEVEIEIRQLFEQEELG
jgi:hypothetical protein